MAEAGPESREELLKHLEDLTGQSFRTREDVRNFVVATVAQQKDKQTRLARAWRFVPVTARDVRSALTIVAAFV